MSETSRQRWLRIHNRLEELRAKYGDETRWSEYQAAARWLEAPADLLRGAPPPEVPPVVPPLTLRQALAHLDVFGETAVFACPRCAQESGKASIRLGIWHCTACGQGGKLALPEHTGVLPDTGVQRV